MIVYHCDNPACTATIEGLRPTDMMSTAPPPESGWRRRAVCTSEGYVEHHACSVACAEVIDDARSVEELRASRRAWYETGEV